MGRWAHLDTDAERLPDGMTRIGYDADSQQYTFRDKDGSIWESAPGCEYGRLFRVTGEPKPRPRQKRRSSGRPEDIDDKSPDFGRDDFDIPEDAKEFLFGPSKNRNRKDSSADDDAGPGEKSIEVEATPFTGDADEKRKKLSPASSFDSLQNEKDFEAGRRGGERGEVEERYRQAASSLGQARRDSQRRQRERMRNRGASMASSTWNSFMGMAKDTFGSLQSGADTKGRELQRRATVWYGGGPSRGREERGSKRRTRSRSGSR